MITTEIWSPSWTLVWFTDAVILLKELRSCFTSYSCDLIQFPHIKEFTSVLAVLGWSVFTPSTWCTVLNSKDLNVWSTTVWSPNHNTDSSCYNFPWLHINILCFWLCIMFLFYLMDYFWLIVQWDHLSQLILLNSFNVVTFFSTIVFFVTPIGYYSNIFHHQQCYHCL